MSAAAQVGLDESDIRAALAEGFSGEVTTDPYVRELYSRDASMYAIRPLAVAFPRSADDVEAIVGQAGRLGVSLIPRGAGTSLAGQTVGAGVVVDLSRHMRHILALDPEARVARVQPGVVQATLDRAAAEHGLMFGADTSTSDRATLGGMIGNNSSGTQSLRYGTTVDHVQRLKVVLSDGTSATLGAGAPAALTTGKSERLAAIASSLPALADRYRDAIERDFPAYWRHTGGYRLTELIPPGGTVDLARLLVGSEGTLAVVTEAELRLVERPGAQAVAVGHFRSLGEALAATEDALACAAVAVELIDRTILDLARERHEYARLPRLLEGSPEALLFVTFLGDTDAEAHAGVERLMAAWRRHGHGYHTLAAVTADVQAELMKVRKAGLGLLMAASEGTRRPLAFVEDTAVPPEALEEYVARFARILERHELTAGFYGHCAVGCLHIRPFVDLRDAGERAAMVEVAEEVLELVLEFRGVNSSEHGDGLARSRFNERVFGPQLYRAMRELKAVFDPHGLLNPGKVVDAPALTEHLRDVEIRIPPPLPTRLDFGPHGMRGEADRCMNIGMCRKTDRGVMCPSYMATREEEHSTRGRANALVHALSDPDAARSLGDRRLYEILDLCLECKACTSECPLGVDMASLKSEFLYHYQRRHGVPVRARLFSRARTVGRLGSATAPISNRVGSARLARRLLDAAVGITAERPLPRYERASLARWARSRRRMPAAGRRGEIVFLADSFTTYSEPAIGRAAIELLELAGWDVRVETRVCCGRPSLSKGLLDRARRSAEALVDRLRPFAERGVQIVGCEPSCVLMVRDEYRRLLPSSPAATLVAAQVRPLSELLGEAVRDGSLPLEPPASLAGREILFHAHCHERAGGLAPATRELLECIPGARVSQLDAGCCGMAGSFGFESEHYELSMRIGELRLFPLLRAAPDALVAATGVSCRQQIRHGTAVAAWHPVELVRSAARVALVPVA